MLTLLISLALASRAEPHVLATLNDPDLARADIVADLIERPRGLSDDVFAQELIASSGMRQWPDQPVYSVLPRGQLSTRAVWSHDGRAIIVKYVLGDERRSGRVCRLTLQRGGWSDALWKAHRWCASALGKYLPLNPPPPITTSKEHF